MRTNSIFDKFTHQYQLSKTLRFELKPIGKTLENIQKKGLLDEDNRRAESYTEMKKTIDEYHKYFIELSLKEGRLSRLEEYINLYNQNKEERDEDAFKKVKESLRKEVVKYFSDGKGKELFKRLDKKELIKDDLQLWIKENGRNDYFDEEFRNFTTYFTGFHENRKNMYSDEEKATAIAYRIIHENLPRFIENIKVYQRIKENHPTLLVNFMPILTEMEEVIQGKSLDEIFTLDYFNCLLTQTGIEFINFIVGGKTPENGKKIRGLNEYINLFNQQQTDKKNRVPKFKQLYKQILSDRSNISFLPDAFKNDTELLEAIENFYQSHLCVFETEGAAINVLNEVKRLVGKLPEYDLTRIYLRNDTSITAISLCLFGDYRVFGEALNYYYENIVDTAFVSDYKSAKTDKKRETLEKKKDKFGKREYISIAVFQRALDSYVIATYDDTHEIRKSYTPTIVADYFHKHFMAKDTEGKESNYDLISNISAKYLAVKGLLNIDKGNLKSLAQDKVKVGQLKAFLDSIMELFHFVKPLNIAKDTVIEKDDHFYDLFAPLHEQLIFLIPLYNMVRNYLTQKPYSTEKIKLNFENSTLLDGWDVNKEKDNSGVLLRKDGMYYLAIMDKSNMKIFKDFPKPTSNELSYKKICYKLISGSFKALPHAFLSGKGISSFKPASELVERYKMKTHLKGVDFSLSDCHKLIDYFKGALKEYYSKENFNFQFTPTEKYNDISDFYKEVDHQGYKITFEKCPESYINQKVEDGELYLFQIYNKDFSPFSKGKPNMHTLYWKALFDEKNLADVVYKLNGQAEIFYRKSSIEEKNMVIHKAKEPINAKNPLTPGKKSTFDYDITKDKRYTVDKFQFHVPITMNFKASGSDIINEQTNKSLCKNADIKIIGLDRGERHLIYLTLIDRNGDIIIQGSLNTIEDKAHNIKTPYHELLEKKEKGRDEARKSWDTIETIKELKEGYISQVVHKIASMMVEHNAIVVMEDLNFGFKRGRFKVEKQVYQKLEKMLIDKLNYLVFKDKELTAPGGLLNALQLTNKFESFKKMGKQSGFLFYVPAWNTSKIDPATGFVNFLQPKYESVKQSQDFFEKFESVRFNRDKCWFEFAFDYDKFTKKAEGTLTKWTVCTTPEIRYSWNMSLNMGKGGYDEYNITEKIETLFSQYKIIYGDGADLREQIIAQNEKDFHQRLLKLLSVTLSLRNTNKEKGLDYILSPVEPFFNSMEADKTQPKDADANGAYHIALKGLWALKQIDKADNFKKIHLAISNKEWLKFVQKRGQKAILAEPERALI